MVIGSLCCNDPPCDKKIIDLWIDTRDCTPLGSGHTWSILNHRGITSRFLAPTAYFVGTTLKFVKGRAES